MRTMTWVEARYNQTARVLGTIAILFAYVGITSYQFKGGGDVLHLIFPDSVPRKAAPGGCARFDPSAPRLLVSRCGVEQSGSSLGS